MDEGLLNDLLECSVCLERLDTSSRVLPCQHTFCLKCLKVIVESHKELRCPECRVLVEVKVEELPPNVLLMRILEGMRNSAPRKVSGQRPQRSGHSQVQGIQPSSREGKQLPPHGRALYNYISKEPSDLSFKKGETILFHKKLDPFWYQGECSGRTGMFPITYVQVIVPLPVPTALCKALYDFRMSAPDEEGCLAFDKGAIITVHRRVDENWAEGRLAQRVGIFPIAFVELNSPAKQLMASAVQSRPTPPLPETSRHHAQNSQRYQQMSISTPTQPTHYQNVAAMSQSHPNYHANQPPTSQILVPTPANVSTHGGVLTTTAIPRNIVEPTQTKHALDLIHFPNNKQLNARENIRPKYDSYNSTPIHKVENTYQNVRNTDHFPVTIANFNANASSDSSSSMNTPVGVSSTTTPNTSSDTSSEAEPSIPSSPDNNTERNATVIAGNMNQNAEEENNDADTSINASMGVLSLNESSTATNTSLNVSLPPAESPKLNASGVTNTSQSQSEAVESTSNVEPSRLDVPSSSKVRSGPDSLLNFGLGLQAALSPSHVKDSSYMPRHREHHHKEKRHSLTPSTHLQGNHSTPNRHSAEILATSLLDHSSERDRTERERERRRRRSRSNERPLPAAYVALYTYKPQKPDELELKKGAIYTVTERCRDGWYKGCSERSERSQRCGVFPGNYVLPAANIRPKHDKQQSCVMATVKPSQAASLSAPDAPPREPGDSPATTVTAQPMSYPWASNSQPQQTTPRSEKSKDKSKLEKTSISSGVSLMKRLAAMKRCKSPPPAGYSMDNPVFEDTPGTSLMLVTHQPVHVRSGSCPSQLLRALPATSGSERLRHKERPSLLNRDHRTNADTSNPWQSQHRKSQSLDVTANRKERHHSQPVKERFRCIVPYPPNSEYELELKVGDIVIVTKKRGDGWYKGTLQRTGRTGLFPASFVQSCPE